MTRVIIRPEAEREIDEARRFYEDEAELGSAFLDEVGRALESLRVMQHRFPEVRSSVRRTIVHRFPYVVYFRMPNPDVVVLAVLHMHRSPRFVAKRIED